MPNEKHTRKQIIDQRLHKAGWDVNDRTQVIEEYRVEKNETIVSEPDVNYSSNQYSDYVLLGKTGKPIAVVEAKKSSVDAEVGREQAKQYCYQIQEKEGELPFCFYTNGTDIFFWDLENYPPQKVFSFPTLDDLERYQHLRKSRRALAEELIDTAIAGRDYQINAIRKVMEAIENRKRKFLLVMATGTGKTRTSIALVEALMRGGWIERVLFLVDRVALKEQALDAFKEHLPNEPRWPKKGEENITTDRRIYVQTCPSMLNLVRDEDNPLSPHFFDLIIVDESHRSIYNTYGEVLNYFNAITIGLTATPTDVIDHNTFELFECENGLPTFAYSYEEAIQNIPPYLCNFEPLVIETNFQRKGINKRSITVADQKRLMKEGKDVEEINYEGTELERKVTNKGTNVAIIQEFMEDCIKDNNGVIPAKSIFFCMSIPHARRLEQLFDSLYPEYKGELAKVMVSEDSRVHGKGGLLDQFKNRDMPRIALSVDMLDTGIDVREICNLVLVKPIYSYTKFWQMIGRGTRLLDPNKIKAWCTQKDAFLIMDCWDNLEYFKINPEGQPPRPQTPLPVRLFGLRLDKIELAYAMENDSIIDNESLFLRRMIAQLPQNSISILDAKALLEQVETENFWGELSEQKTNFLRDHIHPLMRTLSGLDFKAMRFEKDIVEVSIERLRHDEERYEALCSRLIELFSELPLTVNVVAKEEQLIRAALTPDFWAKADEATFDELIERIAPLMKYIDRLTPSGMDFLNLSDQVIRKEEILFGPQHESLSIAKYKEMVEARIKELTHSSPLLQKLQLGQELKPEEIEELTQLLYEERPLISLDLLRKVYENQKAELLAFVQHILGLKELKSYAETVSQAFDVFILTHSNLSSRQLDFLSLLKTFLIDRGNVEKRNLIESPFTRIHPDGIRGLFAPDEIEEILTLIEEAA